MMHGTMNLKFIGFALLLQFLCIIYLIFIQGDQKVSVHLMITIPPSGAQRLLITLYSVCVFYFYTSVNLRIYVCTRPVIGHLAVESAY